MSGARNGGEGRHMDRLIIEEERIEDIVVLKLHGLIDSGTAQFLEDRFNDLTRKDNVRIIVDLQNVDYISSAGWGIFVGEIRGIRQRQGDIKLACMRSDVREVFDLLEFNTLLTPYLSNEEAVSAFAAEQNSKTSK
jgi:anti-sigma B factor antagonist